jgi:hypothetical protein
MAPIIVPSFGPPVCVPALSFLNPLYHLQLYVRQTTSGYAITSTFTKHGDATGGDLDAYRVALGHVLLV